MGGCVAITKRPRGGRAAHFVPSLYFRCTWGWPRTRVSQPRAQSAVMATSISSGEKSISASALSYTPTFTCILCLSLVWRYV